MTKQMKDLFEWKGKEFAIFKQTDHIQFHPANWGLRLSLGLTSTACYRKWIGTYGVVDGKLCIMKIRASRETYQQPYEIHDKNYNQPAINGIKPILTPLKFGFNCKYENIDLQIPYTGALLLTAEFVSGYRFNGYFFSFENVYELVFENGVLTVEKDRSGIAKTIREKQLEMHLFANFDSFVSNGVRDWLRRMFHPGYEILKLDF